MLFASFMKYTWLLMKELLEQHDLIRPLLTIGWTRNFLQASFVSLQHWPSNGRLLVRLKLGDHPQDVVHHEDLTRAKLRLKSPSLVSTALVSKNNCATDKRVTSAVRVSNRNHN